MTPSVLNQEENLIWKFRNFKKDARITVDGSDADVLIISAHGVEWKLKGNFYRRKNEEKKPIKFIYSYL